MIMSAAILILLATAAAAFAARQEGILLPKVAPPGCD